MSVSRIAALRAAVPWSHARYAVFYRAHPPKRSPSRSGPPLYDHARSRAAAWYAAQHITFLELSNAVARLVQVVMQPLPIEEVPSASEHLLVFAGCLSRCHRKTRSHPRIPRRRLTSLIFVGKKTRSLLIKLAMTDGWC